MAKNEKKLKYLNCSYPTVGTVQIFQLIFGENLLTVDTTIQYFLGGTVGRTVQTLSFFLVLKIFLGE